MLTKLFNAYISKNANSCSQDQQRTASILRILTLWLLALCSLEDALATPDLREKMVPVASASPTSPPGSILQLPPDSSSSFLNTPALEHTLQQRMSQTATPDQGHNLPTTSLKVTPAEESLFFQARRGERVRFAYQQGQWHAEVSSCIGDFSRRAVLPVVCCQGTDIASSLKVLSRYPSWYSQRQIHILDRNVCPTLGEVVFVGTLGLKGGGQGQSFGRKGKTLGHPKQQADRGLDCSQPPDFSQKQGPSTSQAASLTGDPATITANLLRASASAKGKELCRSHPTTSASDQGPASIDQLAEDTGAMPSELTQTANRLQEQIDQLYPKLAKATQEDYSQIVNELIVHLVCLLELETCIGLPDNNSAQGYITRLWEVHVTKQGKAAYVLVDQQLKVLLELAHTQALQVAAPNQPCTNKLADMLEAAEILEQLAASGQKQRDTTKPYPNTQRRPRSPQMQLSSLEKRSSSPQAQLSSLETRLLWFDTQGGSHLGGPQPPFRGSVRFILY